MKWSLPWLIPLLGVKSVALASNLRSGRNLQDDNPCAVPLDDVRIVTSDTTWKPSYLASCIRSLEVPKDHMLQHLRNLQTTYRDWDVFYNIANDAEKSDPKSFQEELGYSLFTGPEEGQVNLEEELTALINEVESKGANLGNFYDVQAIFHKPWDTHVYDFELVGNVAETVQTYLYVFPEKALEPEDSANYSSFQRWEPSYNDDGQLEIEVELGRSGGMESFVDKVVMVDGKTPFDWYAGLASNPALPASLLALTQSVGGRMNSLFQNWRPKETFSGIRAVTTGGASLAPDVLPDSFTVTFAGGTSETFIVAASNDLSGDSTDVYNFLNNPPDFDEAGAPYENYAIALGEIADATPDDVQFIPPTLDSRKKHPQGPLPPFDAGRTDSFDFDGYFEAGEKKVGAYKITNDYALFKLWDFDIIDECTSFDVQYCIPQFWTTFTQKAREKDSTKAIIDISQNGGGTVQSGSMLAISMYPFAPFSVWQDTWDSNYNQVMLEYHTTVMPLLDELKNTIADLTDKELEDKIYHLDLHHHAGSQLLAVVEALIKYCESGCEDVESGSCSDRCGDLRDLKEEIEALIEDPSGPQLRKILESILETALPNYDPFQTIGDGDVINPNIRRQVIRGGVQQGLTNRYTFLSENQYNEASVESFRNGFMFEEYTLVGDGTGGSTTAIFAYTAMQLWNNRDAWNDRGVDLPSLTSISYGGTNEPDDLTLAGFPASVQANLNIPFPIIASGLLFTLEFLTPGDTADMISAANQKYQMTLARPPFYLSALPGTPAVNYYSSFMDSEDEEDAVPAQYVKVFGMQNFHIRQIYNGISGEEGGDSSDLEELYAEACEIPTRPTPAPTRTPTPPPTPSPTSLPSHAPSEAPTASPTVEPDLLPVIAVATETGVSAEEIAESWDSFRRKFPDRPFCLLQVRGFRGTDLKVPDDFLFDDKVIYNVVSYDYGNAFRNSNWFNLCGIQESVDLGVRTFPLYIGFSDLLVRSSLLFYEDLIGGVSGNLIRVGGASEGNWIEPLSEEFE